MSTTLATKFDQATYSPQPAIPLAMVPGTLKLTPLAKMLQSFPLAHQKRNGWYVNDDNPRFDFQETPEGNIIVHSWTARTVENILAMGDPPLAKSDLFAKPGVWSACQVRDRLDLPTLAHYMKLPWQFLESIGYRDGYIFNNSQGIKTVCVKLGGYNKPDGTPHTKNKVRLSLDGSTRFAWDINTPGDANISCGLHQLDKAEQAGYLPIGEGESDWATMMFHGLPFLGIPGANAVASLDVSLLQGIPAVYIIEEPDQAKKLAETGQAFYSDMRTHLRAGGYSGEIFSIRFQDATGHKDPSDLHKAIYAACAEKEEGSFREQVTERFRAAITLAIQSAIPEGNEVPAIAVVKQDATYEMWAVELMAVPSEILSPAHKIVLMVIYLYMREVKPIDGKGWQIDATVLCKRAGMAKKTFLVLLCYLTATLGLFSKQYGDQWYTVGTLGKQKRCNNKTLYIEPTPEFARPRGYCVDAGAERNQGGTRIPTPVQETPPSPCEYCGSENTEHYASLCKDCGHVTYPQLPDETSEPSYFDGYKAVESTATILPIVPPSENSDIPKLGITESKVYDTQVGYYGIVESPPEVQPHPQKKTPHMAMALFSREVPIPAMCAETNPRPAAPIPDDGQWIPDKACIVCGKRQWRWNSEQKMPYCTHT